MVLVFGYNRMGLCAFYWPIGMTQVDSITTYIRFRMYMYVVLMGVIYGQIVYLDERVYSLIKDASDHQIFPKEQRRAAIAQLRNHFGG